MGSCHCSEITSHKEKISKLTEILNSLGSHVTNFNSLESLLESVATYNLEAFYAVNMSDLNESIKGLNDGLEEVRSNIKDKILTKIYELQSELSDMEESDKEYHREEERKKKEMEDQKAALL